VELAHGTNYGFVGPHSCAQPASRIEFLSKDSLKASAELAQTRHAEKRVKRPGDRPSPPRDCSATPSHGRHKKVQVFK